MDWGIGNPFPQSYHRKSTTVFNRQSEICNEMARIVLRFFRERDRGLDLEAEAAARPGHQPNLGALLFEPPAKQQEPGVEVVLPLREPVSLTWSAEIQFDQSAVRASVPTRPVRAGGAWGG
jgi:hypothetical protein